MLNHNFFNQFSEQLGSLDCKKNNDKDDSSSDTSEESDDSGSDSSDSGSGESYTYDFDFSLVYAQKYDTESYLTSGKYYWKDIDF